MVQMWWCLDYGGGRGDCKSFSVLHDVLRAEDALRQSKWESQLLANLSTEGDISSDFWLLIEDGAKRIWDDKFAAIQMPATRRGKSVEEKSPVPGSSELLHLTILESNWNREIIIQNPSQRLEWCNEIVGLWRSHFQSRGFSAANPDMATVMFWLCLDIAVNG